MTPSTLTVGHRSGGLCLLTTRTTLRQRVQEAADLAGISKCVPKQPAVSTTLRTSMLEVGKIAYGRRRKQTLHVRQLDDPRSFQCVRVVPGAVRNEYVPLYSAAIDHNWNVSLLDYSVGDMLPNYQTGGGSFLRQALDQTVLQMRDYLPAPVVSQVIVRGLKLWGAMPMKEDGGAWFLDAAHLPQYRAFANHVRGNGDGPLFSVIEFLIDSNPETAGQVLQQVRDTVKAGLDEIMNDVMEATGGMSDRSIDVRLNKANRFLALVEQYENLMGINMPELRDAIDRTKQAVAVNRLLATSV